MLFLIPLLARTVLVGSGVVIANSLYDRTKIERERLELDKEKAKSGSTPPPPAQEKKQ
jgi:hypothetical protein